jgi:hypothetical protein
MSLETEQTVEPVTPRDFIAELCDELYRMDAPEWTQPVPVATLVQRTRMILYTFTETGIRTET